jgi:hypothetical protein
MPMKKSRHYNLTDDYNLPYQNPTSAITYFKCNQTTIESNRDKAMGIQDRNKTDRSPRRKSRNYKNIYQAPKQSPASISHNTQ